MFCSVLLLMLILWWETHTFPLYCFPRVYVCVSVCMRVALWNPASKENNKSHFNRIMWLMEEGRTVKHLDIPAGLIWWHCACYVWRKHGPIPIAAWIKIIFHKGLEALHNIWPNWFCEKKKSQWVSFNKV